MPKPPPQKRARATHFSFSFSNNATTNLLCLPLTRAFVQWPRIQQTETPYRSPMSYQHCRCVSSTPCWSCQTHAAHPRITNRTPQSRKRAAHRKCDDFLALFVARQIACLRAANIAHATDPRFTPALATPICTSQLPFLPHPFELPLSRTTNPLEQALGARCGRIREARRAALGALRPLLRLLLIERRDGRKQRRPLRPPRLPGCVARGRKRRTHRLRRDTTQPPKRLAEKRPAWLLR